MRRERRAVTVLQATLFESLAECEKAEDFAWLEGIVTALERQAVARWL